MVNVQVNVYYRIGSQLNNGASMEELTKEEICIFVEKSITDRQYNDELLFLLPSKTIQRVKETLYFDLNSYQGVISSHSVRHVKKRHPDDLLYICEILEIIQKFSKVQKSITKDQKTGATLVSLEFYKKYDNETVKLVKLKVHREKRLELKTIFIKD
ncbi:MAG TPA: hypothetical protein ENK94_00975 [Campylobacterales bacterium]|nr:hypothetical protein [Campylobacterales bacterium]